MTASIPGAPAAPPAPAPAVDPAARAVVLAAALAYLYPAGAAVAGLLRPDLAFGKNTVYLAAFTALNALVYAALVLGLRRGRYLPAQAALAVALLATLGSTQVREVRELPGVSLALPACRLLLALAMLLLAFDRHRRRLPVPLKGPTLGLAMLTLLLCASDFALLGVFFLRHQNLTVHKSHAFRFEYDLSKVGSEDVVLVGDSFVVGHGLRRDQAYGEVLQRLLRADGGEATVYTLGEDGATPENYCQYLAQVPAGVDARRIILSYYHNDLQPRPTLGAFLDHASVLVGVGCPTWRLVRDRFSALAVESVDAYHASLVDGYRRDVSFSFRWRALRSQVQRFRALAADRSRRPPLFVIVPLMVDYADYPLDAAHRELAGLAREAGFEVLDLLPAFRADLKDGRAYRSSPNDNHFDPRSSALAARTIKAYLDAHGR